MGGADAMMVRLTREIASVIRMADLGTAVRYLGALFMRTPSILRQRSLRPADAVLGGRLLTIRFDGRRHLFQGVPFGQLREIFGREIYFPTSDWRPGHGDRVLDLGTNRGAFAVLCAKRGCEVVAVEALRCHDSTFREQIDLNGAGGNVRHVHGIVGGCSGALAPAAANPDPEVNPAFIAADAIPLDGPAVLALAGAGRVAFLKVDIEGSEFTLFSGDLEWLKLVDRIAMEVHTDHGDPVELCSRLRASGFDAWLTDASGRPGTAVTGPVGFCFATRIGNQPGSPGQDRVADPALQSAPR